MPPSALRTLGLYEGRSGPPQRKKNVLLTGLLLAIAQPSPTIEAANRQQGLVAATEYSPTDVEKMWKRLQKTFRNRDDCFGEKYTKPRITILAVTPRSVQPVREREEVAPWIIWWFCSSTNPFLCLFCLGWPVKVHSVLVTERGRPRPRPSISTADALDSVLTASIKKDAKNDGPMNA